MARGISRLMDFTAEATSGVAAGLESQLVNELCLSSRWNVSSVWTFRVSTHINVLELSAVVRLVNNLVRKGKSLRVVILVDSNVVRCACSKGRSSSKALTKLLVRLAALSLVGGLYLVFGFVPTRHNVADDPTRDTDVVSLFRAWIWQPGIAWTFTNWPLCLSFVVGLQIGLAL
jgi:hypothetical protein